MVSDRYEDAYEAIIKKTENKSIKWRPISEYIEDYINPDYNESDLSQHIQMLCCAEGFELHLNESFYCFKDGKYLALLCYKQISGKDGSIDEIIELVGSLRNKKPIMLFPEYIEGGFERMKKAIMDYWAFKQSDYNLNISDRFELLETFI